MHSQPGQQPAIPPGRDPPCLLPFTSYSGGCVLCSSKEKKKKKQAIEFEETKNDSLFIPLPSLAAAHSFR